MTNDEENEAKNRYHSYMVGWRHGASIKSMDPKFTHHPKYAGDYERGYTEGSKARAQAARAERARLGLPPENLLRLTGDVEG